MADQKDFVYGHTEPAGRAAPAFVPDHELLRLIGKGSYGEVWLARNSLGTFRAVKIVYAKTFEENRPFEREFNGVQNFEPVSRLHEGLMDILQVGRNDDAGHFYCVMELADDAVRGQVIDPEHYSPRTLAYELRKHKRLSIPECLRLGVALTEALDFLHGRGLIHRDVKPSNVVFVSGMPKLADIGLVAEKSEARSYVGTEGFIPPEGPGTVQADIYSLGKVLYELSTGKDRHDYPQLPAELGEGPQVDEIFGFSRIFLKACRADPRQRYKSAAAMAADLRVSQNGGPPRFRAFAGLYLARVMEVIIGLAVIVGIWLVCFGKKSPANPGGTPAGLVSWWGGENSADDLMGGNHGKFAGTGTVSYGPGIAGQAFVFDGTHRDRIDLGNPTNLQLQNFTIEAWIKRASPTNISLDDMGDDDSHAGEGGQIFGYGFNGYCLGMFNDGRLCLSRVGGTDSEGILSKSVVADTNWHHVAVVKDGARAAFYIDGAAASREFEYHTKYYFETPAAIGSLGGGFGGTFWGMIDEVAVYREPLSAGAIQMIYQARSAGKCLPRFRPFAPPAGLVDWWPADGDAKSVSGAADGILVNGATFAPGKVGKAFRFSGSDQYVKIPKSPKLDVGEQVSVAFWMKADPENSMRSLQGLVATDFYLISICPGHGFKRVGVNFSLSTDGGKSVGEESWPNTADANDGGAVVTAGQWHHIAGTYDGASMQLYLDGRPWGKSMRHTGTISPMLADSFLGIGSEGGRSGFGHMGRDFQGLIDEVSLYNQALAADQIEYLYKAGCAGMSVDRNRSSR